MATASPKTYNPVAIGLHWLIALMIPTTFALGLFMVGLPLSPNKLKFYSWHKWIGVTIFMIMVLRLTWRFTHPVPTAPAGMPTWQRLAASGAHTLLYLLLLTIPLSGWLMSSAKGVPTVYLGLWQLPDLVAANEALGERLESLHVFLNFLMAVIVLLHVSAALKHHLIDRDDVLARMVPPARRD